MVTLVWRGELEALLPGQKKPLRIKWTGAKTAYLKQQKCE